TAIFAGAGVWLFARRDVGGVAVQLPSRAGASTRSLPTSDWSLRSLYGRSLGMITSSTLWWTLIIALLGAWLVVIVKQTETQLRSLLESSNAFAQIIKLGGSDT